jgi:hypothetical protein
MNEIEKDRKERNEEINTTKYKERKNEINGRIEKYKIVCKSNTTGRLERELQMVQFSVTRCSCIATL